MSRDDAYLLDMLLAARRAAGYASSVSEEQFQRSGLHQDAIVRRLEIIGEAARHVSPQMRSMHPAIQWEKITGMRHRIAHDYRNIDQEIVWRVVSEEVPVLIDYLSRVVPPE